MFTDAPTEAAPPLRIYLVRPLAPIKGRRQCWSLNLSSSSVASLKNAGLLEFFDQLLLLMLDLLR